MYALLCKSYTESIKHVTVNLVSTLPLITNFTVNKDLLYNNRKVEFIWNNPNIEGATYIIQESTDSFTWVDLVETSEESDVFNIHKEVTLSNNSGKMYYRVKVVRGDEYSYSRVLETTVYDYFGEIKNIRLDGAKLKAITNVEEGDESILSWTKADDASYRVLVSADGIKWSNLLSYSSVSSIDDSSSTVQTKIGFNYKYFHFLLKIEAQGLNQISYSSVYEFYVKVEDVYAEDVIVYMHNEFELFTSEMGIYR